MVNCRLLAGLLALFIISVPNLQGQTKPSTISTAPLSEEGSNISLCNGEYTGDLRESIWLSPSHFLWLNNPQSKLNWDLAKTAVSEESGKNRQKAGLEFFNSLLIPGWGQLKKGQNLKAYTFFAAEISLITSLIAFKTYQGWLEDDYETFAAQHAGISGSREHQFYVDIGNWSDRGSYNEQRLRNRQFDQMYTSSGDGWSWDSEENRSQFKSMRLTADRTSQKALIAVGIVIINHLLSAVDASRKSSEAPNISFYPDNKGGAALGLKF